MDDEERNRLTSAEERIKALEEERRETVAKLRELCKIAGDNDWPDDLYLANVIEKHLLAYMWDES